MISQKYSNINSFINIIFVENSTKYDIIIINLKQIKLRYYARMEVFMELDSIKRIVQTEQEAQQILQQAEEQARTIIQNAINGREQKELFSKKLLEETKQNIEVEAEKEQKEAIKKINDATQYQCEQIEKKASEKIQTAVDMVFKEVIS